MSIVPEEFVRTTLALHGEAGADWLRRLPAIVADRGRRWSLAIGKPFPDPNYNVVIPAVRADGTAAVLKICFLEQGFFTEAEALRRFAGRGAVLLVEVDLDQGALLLERAEPGTSIEVLEDDEVATSAAAAVLRRLWRPVPAEHPFPTVADWAADIGKLRRRFDGGTGPLPAALVDRAERLFAELLASSEAPVLLHGDLHHGNVLAARREPWLAIDPKGILGEPTFDTASLLFNPASLLDAPDPGRILARRIDQLADELDFERARVHGWGLAKAVLSAVWSVEDGDIWDQALVCAQLLAEIRV